MEVKCCCQARVKSEPGYCSGCLVTGWWRQEHWFLQKPSCIYVHIEIWRTKDIEFLIPPFDSYK